VTQERPVQLDNWVLKDQSEIRVLMVSLAPKVRVVLTAIPDRLVPLDRQDNRVNEATRDPRVLRASRELQDRKAVPVLRVSTASLALSDQQERPAQRDYRDLLVILEVLDLRVLLDKVEIMDLEAQRVERVRLDREVTRDFLAVLDSLDGLDHKDQLETQEPKDHLALMEALEHRDHRVRMVHPVQSAVSDQTECWVYRDFKDRSATQDNKEMQDSRVNLVRVEQVE